MERIRVEPKKKKPGRHKFVKGHKYGQSGRPKGATNKITRALKDAITMAAEEVGGLKLVKKGKRWGWVATNEGGLVGYLKWLAVEQPHSFTGLLGKLLPYQLSGKIDTTVQHQHDVYHRIATEDLSKLTVQELIAMYREAVTKPDQPLALPPPQLKVVGDE